VRIRPRWTPLIELIIIVVDYLIEKSKKRRKTNDNGRITKRADKAQALRCIKLKDGSLLVESQDGKILYPVSVNGTISCTCADFQRNSKTDQSFRCKHILSAMECDDPEYAETAEKRKARINPESLRTFKGESSCFTTGS